MECVRQGKKLWAVAYLDETPERAGNRLLLQDAAIPLNRVKDVKEALDNAAQYAEDNVKQLAMELV